MEFNELIGAIALVWFMTGWTIAVIVVMVCSFQEGREMKSLIVAYALVEAFLWLALWSLITKGV